METEEKIEHRCIKCHKLLANGELKSGQVEIKCTRCKHINFFFDKEPDQVIITDTDGVILYANESLTRLTGYSVAEMIGNHPSLWGGQMSKKFYKDLWYKIKVKKEIATVTVTNKKKNGELYAALLRISPVLDNEGEPKFFIGIETEVRKIKNNSKS